jgi:HlyD family secretion protein
MTKFLIFILLSCTFIACKSKNTVTKPLRKDIKQAVYASGKLYPVQRRLLSVKTSGYVKQIFVKAGDTIQAGMPILAIGNEVAAINLNSAKNNLDLAGNNAAQNSATLQTAREEVSNAQSKYGLDSANAVRFQNLYQQNATSKLNAEQAKTQATISKQNLQKARLQVQILQQKFNADLTNAQNVYQIQKSIGNDFVLYADANLRVYDIKTKVGELVSPQFPLVEAGQAGNFEVELAIDENDVVLVKEGQEVVFELGAAKNSFLKGKLLTIYPSINQQNKTAKVVASIEQSATIRFFSGMSVEANIVVAERKNALVISRNYLFDNEYVKMADSKNKVKISKGIEDLEYVEIKGGIDENTEITDRLD